MVGKTKKAAKPAAKKAPAKGITADTEKDPSAQQNAKLKAAKLVEAQRVQEAAAKKLPKLAEEIAHRLDSADVNDKKSHDHRVSAAIQLAAAEEQCKLAGIKFTEWFEKNIPNRKYDTVQRLLKAGKAGDETAVAAAIADMRQKNTEANKKHRAKKKAGGHSRTPTGKGSTSSANDEVRIVTDRIKSWPDSTQVDYIGGIAKKHGLVVVPEKTVQVAKDLTAAKGGTVAQAMAIYKSMKADEKGEFFAQLEKATGYKLVRPEEVKAA